VQLSGKERKREGKGEMGRGSGRWGGEGGGKGEGREGTPSKTWLLACTTFIHFNKSELPEVGSV